METRSRAATAVLALLIAAGLCIRLYHLDDRSLTHPEFFVPRIDMPEWAAAPAERHTLVETVHGTLASDVHPPGYYILMWVWTALAGTGLLALRLPSALAGTATLGLLYALGKRGYGTGAALLATALLALHGTHLFWSQLARMWVFIAMLAVWSVLLLASGGRWSASRRATYLFVSATGLWTEYYYWPFFLAQMIWVLWRDARTRAASATLATQFLTLVLAAPVPLILALQTGRHNYLSRSVLPTLVETLGFGRLFDLPFLADRLGTAGIAAALALAGAGAVLLLAGTGAGPGTGASTITGAGTGTDTGCPLLRAQLAAAVGVNLLLVATLPLWGSAARVAAGCTLAWLPVATWWAACRSRAAWEAALARLAGGRSATLLLGDPVRFHALMPLLLLLGISIAIPVIADRGLLILTPFLLLTMSSGVMRVGRRRAVRGVIAGALLVLGGGSAYHYANVPTSLRDYGALARELTAAKRPDDLVAVENRWWATPMIYYLPADRHQLAPLGRLRRQLEAAGPCGAHRPARLWIVAFTTDRPVDGHFERAAHWLPEYRMTRKVTALEAGAALFERDAGQCNLPAVRVAAGKD